MRSGILFLPFVSFFSMILALATGHAYQAVPWIAYGLWLIAGISLVAWIVLDSGRLGRMFKNKGAKHGISQGISVILAILLAIGIGFITKRDRFNKSFDLTKAGTNTLSAESEKLVNQLKEKGQEIQILGFFQDEMKKVQFQKLLSLYQSAGVPFAIEYIDPQTDPTRAMAESITVPDTVLFKLGTQESRLTTFNEEKFSNALVRIMKNKEHVVYFLSGHGEPDITNQEAVGMSLAKAELESERFVVKQAKLSELGKYPEDADLMIIAGPRYDLLLQEKTILEGAMKNAKPIMILVDALVDLPNLKSLAAEAGIGLNDDLLIINPQDPRAKVLGQNNAIITELDKFSPITADFSKRGGVAFVTANTRSLAIVTENKLAMKTVQLAKTANMIIKVKNVRTEADLKGGVHEDQIEQGVFDVFAVSSGQVGGDKVASADSKIVSDKPGEANKAKELRVFVGGTSQLVSNIGAQRGENLDLFINAVNYLLQDEDFLSIRAKESDPSRLDLTTPSSQFLLLFLAFIYPLIFFGAGTYVWAQRRRA
jgi:ABC-type uncharacterized transport system involved in gliding motility auxiliary subunit